MHLAPAFPRQREELGTTLAVVRSALLLGLALLSAGCTSAGSDAPVVLTLNRGDYSIAFDAAVELIAHEGMPADLRDRDGGVIESRPAVSGSVFEPWDWSAGSASAAVDDTLNHQRRRVRFEFLPADFRPLPTNDSAPLQGQLTPGSVEPDAAGAVDLPRYDGPIEVRVWVYVERATTPYLQRPTWSFRGRSFASNPEDRERRDDGTTRDPSKWTPVSRDPAMEREMLEKLKSKLTAPTV